ncbi:MAG TPA: hypothetical protein VMZ29_03395 [Candidatus Bathyarchaeia archaeon]|nr:hypothetical protein [Candidatus Bathyarchaeia archaeon]
MLDVGIEALLIMDKAGIPLLFQKFNPKRADIEPILLSGFLTAVKAFSTILIEESDKDFHLDYGKRVITILSGAQVIFVAIHNDKEINRISPILFPLIKEFENDYYKNTLPGDSGPIEEYYPFKERIAETLGLTNPSLEWIPLVLEDHDHNLILTSSLAPYLVKNYTIKTIIEKSNLTKNQVLKELSRLWAYGQINFRNVITREDIIIPTSKISSFLQPSSLNWKLLSKEFPNIINILPYIVSHIDGRTSLGTVIENYANESPEIIYWLMDYLYIQDAITILTPEKRRVLMAKEILEKSLEISDEIYSKKVTITILKSVLQELNVPEVISQIRATDHEWQLDYNFMIYERLSPEKVLTLYEYWLEVLRLFIFTLPEKKRKKYIEKLTEELDYDYFVKYIDEDLEGFEEFAFWLEIVFN